MKLFRGDWSVVAAYNTVLLFVVITTGEPELLYLLLGNIALIAIQLFIKYNKYKELFEQEEPTRKYNDLLLPEDAEEQIKKRMRDSMYNKLSEDKKKRWVILEYISYCIIKRKLELLNSGENDLEDIETFISNNYEKIYLLKEEQMDYLLTLSKKWKNPHYSYLREIYYEEKIKDTLIEMDRDNIFKNNYEFFFDFEKDTDNEIKNYIKTGNFGNFSNYFKNKINNLFQTDIDLYEYYFTVMESICDELWYELYEKRNINKI